MYNMKIFKIKIVFRFNGKPFTWWINVLDWSTKTRWSLTVVITPSNLKIKPKRWGSRRYRKAIMCRWAYKHNCTAGVIHHLNKWGTIISTSQRTQVAWPRSCRQEAEHFLFLPQMLAKNNTATSLQSFGHSHFHRIWRAVATTSSPAKVVTCSKYLWFSLNSLFPLFSLAEKIHANGHVKLLPPLWYSVVWQNLTTLEEKTDHIK